MKVSIFIYLLLIFVVCDAEAATQLARTFFIKGKAYAIRDGKKLFLKKDDFLCEGEKVVTADDSLLILSFGSDFASKIKISPSSSIVITREEFSAKEKKTSLVSNVILHSGSLLIDYVNKNKNKEQLVVKTRSASLGVRGTRFFTNVGKDGEMSMSVKEGTVSVQSFETHNVIPVEAGNGTLLNEKGGIIKPRHFSWHEKINWKVDPKEGHLTHPGDLFTEIAKQYEIYKQEQEYLLKKFKEENQKTFDNWVNENEDLKGRMFSP